VNRDIIGPQQKSVLSSSVPGFNINPAQSLEINAEIEFEQLSKRRHNCGLPLQLIRSARLAENGRRDDQRRQLRRLMAALLSEAVSVFQRNLFHTSPHERCKSNGAEFWLFKDKSESPFSLKQACAVLSLDPQHIRRHLREWQRNQAEEASPADIGMTNFVQSVNSGPALPNRSDQGSSRE
jgi:hypothetical protein